MTPQTDRSLGNRARLRAMIALTVVAVALGGLYLGDPDNFPLWAKALHVIAVISWMAGLLYMPRLFIYHHDAEPGSTQSETFKVMEIRLFSVIMRPAMVATWILGLYIGWVIYGFQGGWLHAKLLLVVFLTGYHEFLGSAVKSYAADRRERSPRFWRMMNEVPTLLMIAIVILVIVKPF